MTVRALATAVLLMLAAACKSKSAPKDAGPPDIPPLLGPVTVSDLSGQPPPGVQIDVAALTAQLQNQLRSSGVFATSGPDAGGPPTARVRVELGVAEVRTEEKGAARARMRFRVDTRPSGLAGGHWNEDVEAGGETVYALKPAPDLGPVFSKLVSRMLGDLTASYVGRQKIWRGGDKEVSAALASDAGEARAEAIRVVAERRLTSEVPTLLKLLSSEEEPVRDAALGALVELRERRAVTEIAKQRSMRDQREMRKILDAIATLGGDEAVEYLSFVADAHEDEEIKGMAKQALARLKRRAAAAPPP
jgi:hypothetical protein